jgi:hypothetical protein
MKSNNVFILTEDKNRMVVEIKNYNVHGSAFQTNRNCFKSGRLSVYPDGRIVGVLRDLEDGVQEKPVWGYDWGFGYIELLKLEGKDSVVAWELEKEGGKREGEYEGHWFEVRGVEGVLLNSVVRLILEDNKDGLRLDDINNLDEFFLLSRPYASDQKGIFNLRES